MANYSDLQTLFNNGMGSFASIQAGRQAGDQEAENEMKRKIEIEKLVKAQLENQRSQQMNPLDAMFRQGEVNQQAAQLPGFQAASANLQSQNRIQQSTEGAQIAEKLMSLSTKIGEEGMKQMGIQGQKIGQAAAMLQQVPPMMLPQATKKVFQTYGVDENNPFVQLMMQSPPDKILPAMKITSEGMAMASEKYIQDAAITKQREAAAMERTTVQNQSQEKIAGGNNATQIRVAEMNNEARMQAAAQTAAARQAVAGGKMSIDQKIVALSSIPEAERTPDEQRQLSELAAQRLAVASASANGVPAQVLGQPSPQAAAQAASPFVGGNKPVATKPTGNVRQVGTSNGKPVYEDEQGNRFIKK